jgi:hypothetical protein
MENQDPTTATEYESKSTPVPWRYPGQRTGSAFTIGGVLLIASFFVPVGLAEITNWNWVSGIVLVGFAVIAVTAGQVGLYQRDTTQSSNLTTAAVLSAFVAGGGALALVTMGGVAYVGIGILGLELGTPKMLFKTIAFLTSSGYALGFSLFGIAGLRTESLSKTPSQLLLFGGVALLIPVVAMFLQAGFGVNTPEWLFIPALVVVAIDTLAIGYVLKNSTTDTGSVDA